MFLQFSNSIYASFLGRFTSVLSNWITYSFPPRWFPPHLRCNGSKHYACARSVRCHGLTSYLKAWTWGYYQQDGRRKESHTEVHWGEATIDVSDRSFSPTWLFPLLSLTLEHRGLWRNCPRALTHSSWNKLGWWCNRISTLQ